MKQPSAKPIQPGFIFTRRLTLSAGSLTDEAPQQVLSTLPGMVGVRLGADKVQLRYDASQLHISQVIDCLGALNIQYRDGLLARIRLHWYHYVDSNAAANANRKETHCCNKPPKGY